MHIPSSDLNGPWLRSPFRNQENSHKICCSEDFRQLYYLAWARSKLWDWLHLFEWPQIFKQVSEWFTQNFYSVCCWIRMLTLITLRDVDDGWLCYCLSTLNSLIYCFQHKHFLAFDDVLGAFITCQVTYKKLVVESHCSQNNPPPFSSSAPETS